MTGAPVKHTEIRPADWRWRFFKPSELACKGDGMILVVPAFLDRLERLRYLFARPLIVTSGYRSPAYNAAVASTGEDGPHTTGRAVDLAIAGEPAAEVLALALDVGFTGIGVDQKGAWGRRFLHLDDIPDGIQPRPRIWSY